MNIIFLRKITRIIISHLEGTISDNDKTYLQKWIHESEENKALFIKVSSAKFIDGIAGKKSELEKDIAAEWIKLRTKISKKNKVRKFTYWISSSAAAVLILFAATWFFNLNSINEATPLAKAEPIINPGTNRAVLTLANGKEVTLKTDSIIYILKNNKIVVNKNDTVSMSDTTKSDVILYNSIFIPKGGEYIAKLDDGTKIYLNSDTRVKIPVAFDDESRRLIFEQGEIYCEIAKDKNRPFIININDVSIKVLGTEFNVRSYKSEQSIVTTLVEGSVEISKGDIIEILTPGIQARIMDGAENIITEYVNVYKYIAWKQGRMVFENQSLDRIMTDLSRWYDIEFSYKDVNAKELRFTIDIIKYENLNDVLDLFEEMDKVGFEIEEKKVIVSRLN